MEELMELMELMQTMGDLSVSPAMVRCAYGQCPKGHGPFKACAACSIVSYCSKDCQRADWTRHKSLCVDCRPFKSNSQHLSPSQKKALDEYSKLRLPAIDEEYRRKYPGEVIHCLFIKSGLVVIQRVLSTNIRDLSGNEASIQDCATRWHEVSPNLRAFLRTAEPGDIFCNKLYMLYDPGAPQQFRNTPMAEPGVLKNGKTVVDIGFVDFGITFDSINTLSLKGDPLIVIGYDAEAQCVAKSLIMVEMMKNANVQSRSIVEVWLSSLWSKSTFQAFKKATRQLLDNSDELDPRVRAIIKFWSESSKISRKAALDFQMKALVAKCDSKFASECCSLESESDRVEMLRYHLTRALYEDDSMVVGSVVMGRNSEKFGVKQLFESCLQAVPTYVHYAFDPNFRPGNSFMARNKLYFEETIQKYMRHIRNGTLVFTPKLGVVSLDNADIIQEIKALDPFMIHWSNVVDYMKPKHFHAIAKKLSGPDTVHALHSCNWSTGVCGTDAYDFNTASRLHFYSGGLVSMEAGHSLIEGVHKYSPLPFRAICTAILCRRYVNKFFQYFFQDERVNCACLNGQSPLKPMNPFSRSFSTAHIMFAYKENGISFGVDSYDFTKGND